MGKEFYAVLVLTVACLRLQTASAGSITMFNPSNAVSSGGISVTISGLDFGTTSYTPTITFTDSNTVCTTTSWTSTTTVNCMPAYENYGTGIALKTRIRGGLGGATFQSNNVYFSFDAPTISDAIAGGGANVLLTGGQSVTITGLNFAKFNHSPTVRVRATCQTSSWNSATTLTCLTSKSTRDDTSYAESVTLTGQVGTMNSLFTFDAPVISQTGPNIPTTAYGSLTLFGSEFAPVDWTPTVRVKDKLCVSTSWVSNSLIKCGGPVGYGWKVQVAVTVSAIVGTKLKTISYDTPIVSNNDPVNRPPAETSDEGAYITIFGLNFATTDATATAFISNSSPDEPCETTSWSTDTTVRCMANKNGWRGQRTMGVGGLGSSGTGGKFTYDAPVISGHAAANRMSTGSLTVTISGLNFGYVNTTPESYLGSSVCPTTSWSSTTTVSCGAQEGGAGTAMIAMGRITDEVNKYYGTLLSTFSFDAPVVSDSIGPNGVVTGGTQVSVLGFNFGKDDFTMSGQIGATHCSTVSWVTESSSVCYSQAGVGSKRALFVTVGGVVGTIANIFSFDSPVITFFNAYNGPAESGYTVTMDGFNFNSADVSPTARIGNGFDCASSIWVSDTTIKCRTSISSAMANDGRRHVAVTISAVVGTRVSGFSFNAPVPTDVNPSNSPNTGGGSITLNGMSFGSFDFSVTASVEKNSCATASWVTSTTVTCQIDPAVGSSGTKIPLVLTVGATVGTRQNIFSFDSPIISDVPAGAASNFPTSTGPTITIAGLNFGYISRTPTSMVNSESCQTTAWTSASSVHCTSAGGSGIDQSVNVLMNAISGTLRKAFTFDVPVLSYVNLPNAPTTGGSWTTINGMNFGATVLTSTVRIGTSACTTSHWTAHTSLSCYTQTGYGLGTGVFVSVTSQTGTVVATYTYDSPAVTQARAYNVPSCASVSVTIQGLNFGAGDQTASARIGSSACSVSQWNSATSVKCTTTGQGGSHLISITIASLVGTNVQQGIGVGFVGFTYDAPVMSQTLPTNIMTTSGGTVSLHGFNFAASGVTPTLSIGQSVCATTAWYSISSVRCNAPYATGAKYSVGMTISSVVATRGAVLFTFDSPVLTASQSENGPTSSGSTITMLGVNFGFVDATATATVASTQCGTTSWISATNIVCSSAGGGGGERSQIITVSTVVGTGYRMFTYDTPVITAQLTYNAPAVPPGVVASSVTIQGFNFGMGDDTSTVQLGGFDCGTTVWSTTTSVICNTPASYGGSLTGIVMTLSSAVGTQMNAFTYDGPILTMPLPSSGNLVSTQGASVTLIGFNFGGLAPTPSTIIGKTMCATTSWTSGTSLTCTSVYAGGGALTKQSIGLTISTQVGTKLGFYTYDSPVISLNILPWYPGVNAPSSGGTMLTVRGINFASSDTTPTVTIVAYSCRTTGWSSATSLFCTVPAAPSKMPMVAGKINKAVGITIGGLIGTANANWFSFDSPMVSDVKGVNGAPSGGVLITLHGMNFGGSDNTPTMVLGATQLTTVTWTSVTSVVSRTTPGTGKGLDSALTISSVISTMCGTFTFDAPVITTVAVTNGPTAGGASITLEGTNFGFIDGSATSLIGPSQCETTAYVSGTSLTCQSRAGNSVGHRIAVTIGNVVGSKLLTFSFDAPALTQSQPYNNPNSAGAVVTFIGLNLGGTDATPTAVLGGTQCETSVWTSTTAVKCTGPAGYGTSVDIEITVTGLVGTLANSFSYDAPAISSVPANSPTQSAATLTLRGLNFAPSDPSPTAFIESSVCQTASWLSLSSLKCLNPSGSGTSKTVGITLSGTVGTHMQALTYDGPVVTYVNRYNAPLSGKAYLSISGSNFAQINTTPSTTLGSTVCHSASWTSATMVTCTGAAGSGSPAHMAVNIQGFSGTMLNVLTYDSPVLTYSEPVNQPTSASSSLTLSGFNFGVSYLSPLGRVGSVACRTTAYQSDTAVICHTDTGAGTGDRETLVVTVATVMGTVMRLFSYNAPVVSSLNPTNTPTSQGSVVTMLGVSFGQKNLTPTSRIGSTVCVTSVWTSTSTVKCTSSAAVGTGLSTYVVMGSLIGTLVGQFSFDGPVVTSLYRENGATSGSAPVTLRGLNFAQNYDPTPSVVLRGQHASTASWTSVTSTVFYTPGYSGGDTADLSALTVSSLVGTIVSLFSFNAPVLTQLQSPNTATSNGNAAVITILGTNMAPADPTPTVRLGSVLCATSVWTSSTVTTCTPTHGAGKDITMKLTIAALSGTLVGSFTFDAPVITEVSPNSPASGQAQLTVNGLNFGYTAVTSSIRLGATACGTTGWTSSTSLSCTANGARGADEQKIGLAVTMSTVVGTVRARFTYDSPVISQTVATNLATTAGGTVTVRGFNFGAIRSTPTISIGASVCGTSAWITDSSVKCLVKHHGVSTKLRSVVTMSSLVGTQLSTFTFDSPVLTQVYRTNSPSCGQSSVTLSGFNFGAYYPDITPSVRIGSTSCGTSSWTSVSSVKCSLAAGTGFAEDAIITTASLIGTMTSQFTYDSPVISTFSTVNGPQTGSASVTIYGFNLGLGNKSPTAVLGQSACETTVWASATNVVCSAPPGASISHDITLTVGFAVGTVQNIFTFDAPALSFTQLYNMPTTAGGQVTVEGANFASSDYTPTVRIQSTMCGTTSWTTSSSVICVAPSGMGISRGLSITLSSLLGTNIGLFSYDSPMVTGLSLGNAPTTGGKSVTVQGSNFAVEDGTVTALVGTSSCATTSWTSSSVVTCLLSGGSAGSNYQVAVTLVGLIGTKQNVFSYDAPLVSEINKPNSPLSGQPVLTMIGTNFASSDYSVNAYIGTSVCSTTSWLSVTSSRCQVTAGFAGMHTMSFTVENMVGTSLLAFTYDSPVVTYVENYNAPNSAGVSITLSGTNFGAADYSVTVVVGETACSSSKWVSGTSATCGLQEGVGVGPFSSVSEHRAAITVGTGVGTRIRSFTFDAPVVTYASRVNAPSTGGQTVTVNGVNFGLSDYSATVGVGKTACETSSWTSLTQVVCGIPAGGGSGYQLAVTVVDVSGTRMSIFSYDAPILSQAEVNNGPVSSGAVITIHGSGFGLADNTPSVHVGVSSCGSTSWTSLSTLTCYTPIGVGTTHDVVMTVGSLIGTAAGMFTYDAPTVSDISTPENGPITGGASLTIIGSNFAPTDMTPTSIIGSGACETSVWVTSSAVKCVTGPGYGFAQNVNILLEGIAGTLVEAFSFDAPVVSNSEINNVPTSAGPRITVSGSDFGVSNFTPTARVGKSRCATTSWITYTSLVCDVSSGVGSNLQSSVSLFGLDGCLADVFTYDMPILTHIQHVNTVQTGGDSITMFGTNFGVADPSSSARIGSTPCAYTAWVSATSAICEAPVGQGHSISVALTVAAVEGTLLQQFTFNGPVITGLIDANAPSTAGSYVTVSGLNFAMTDLTMSVTMSNALCGTSTWSSSTSVNCKGLTGYGVMKNVGMTISSVVGTGNMLLTFDAPAVTASNTPNIAMSGGPSLTVLGLNFWSSDLTVSQSLGVALCSTTAWSTSTSVVCSANGLSGASTQSMPLTVSGHVGTLFLGFSYDAPTASYITEFNSANSGSVLMTVTGLNFYSVDESVTARVGGAACMTTSWTAGTTLTCVNSASAGVAQSVAIDVAGVAGTLAGVFTYDAPSSSNVMPLNSPTSSGASVSVFGHNFGLSDFTPSVQIGMLACSTVLWTTSSSVNCKAPANYNTDLTITLSVGSMVGTHTLVTFTYDSPVVSHTVAFNSPSTHGAIMSIHGTNFHTTDITATATIGTTQCTSTSWTSHTHLSCHVPADHGLGHTVSVLQATSGTKLLAFTYDAPALTSTHGTNSPTSGSATVTFAGMNFGASDFSPTAVLGETQCATSDWVSDTSIKCSSAIGRGLGLMASASDAQSGNLQGSFTYDNAVLTNIAAANSPTSGMASITLTGFNFVTAYDPSPTIQIGKSVCQTTSWSTGTSLTCLASVGVGVQAAVTASVTNMVGTLSHAFSYDNPVITGVMAMNAAASAGTSVTLFGINFGMESPQHTPTTHIGGLPCAENRVLSNTAIICRLSAGSGDNHDVHSTISSLVGTYLQAFSYDAPVASHTSVVNGAPSGDTTVVVSGLNFGNDDFSVTARVGVSVCTTSSWHSATAIACTLPAGSGAMQTLAVSVSKLVGTQQVVFSYDSPVVTRIAVVNAPGSGGLQITLHGTNYGSIDIDSQATVGETPCSTTRWTSSTQVVCDLMSSGNGMMLKAHIALSGLVGTALRLFTYDSPVVTYNAGVNAATTAGTTLTITGTNFGHQDFGGVAAIGQTSCTATGYATDTSITCTVPAGTGRARIVYSQAGLVATKLMSFTYDSPVVTGSAPLNGPTKPGATLTLLGTNFGPEGSSSTALVGLSFCQNSEWLTTTSVMCITPSGASADYQLNVVMNGMVGTMASRFSYDAPTLSFVSTGNGPLDGVMLTLHGHNFGNLDFTPTLTVGSTHCTSVGWTSDSAVVCMTPAAGAIAAGGNDVSIQMGGATYVATQAGVFSHDAPAVKSFIPANGPSSGGAIITVTGSNLGTAAMARVASVGGVVCTGTTYTSSTSMLCSSPASSGTGQNIDLTVSGVIGTAQAVFSYDAPAVKSVNPTNGMYIGNTRVTVSGTNFGINSVVSIGGTDCVTTTWTSSNSIECTTPAVQCSGTTAGTNCAAVKTAETAADVVVKVGSDSSTLPTAFTFNLPSVGSDGTTSGLTMDTNGALVIRLSNLTQYHQYTFTDTPALNGALHLEFDAGYTPRRQDTFVLFKQTGTFTGQFAPITSNVVGATIVPQSTPGVYAVQVQVPGCDPVLKCHGHGTCDADNTGECQCDEGYSGVECETACYYVTSTATWNCECSAKLPSGVSSS